MVAVPGVGDDDEGGRGDGLLGADAEVAAVDGGNDFAGVGKRGDIHALARLGEQARVGSNGVQVERVRDPVELKPNRGGVHVRPLGQAVVVLGENDIGHFGERKKPVEGVGVEIKREGKPRVGLDHAAGPTTLRPPTVGHDGGPLRHVQDPAEVDPGEAEDKVLVGHDKGALVVRERERLAERRREERRRVAVGPRVARVETPRVPHLDEPQRPPISASRGDGDGVHNGIGMVGDQARPVWKPSCRRRVGRKGRAPCHKPAVVPGTSSSSSSTQNMVG